ncbi:MAG: FAD binding domain-containing protein [Spirochaetales bacterium]|nr:FAD binding domain-containing protein [Spirochaetales bacterium]
MNYFKPESLDEYFNCIEKSEGFVRPLAGGADIMHRLKKKFLKKDGLTLIDINVLSDLKELEERDGELRIGALTKLSRLQEFLAGKAGYNLLHTALGSSACSQIRHQGTVGGHLAGCLPGSHLFPVLLLHEARIEIVSPGGMREVDLDTLQKQPYHNNLKKNELISALILPALPAKKSYYWGEGERKGFCFAPFVLGWSFSEEAGLRIAGGNLPRGAVRFRVLEEKLAGSFVPLIDCLKEEFHFQEKQGNPLSEYQKTLLYRFMKVIKDKGEIK